MKLITVLISRELSELICYSRFRLTHPSAYHCIDNSFTLYYRPQVKEGVEFFLSSMEIVLVDLIPVENSRV